MEIKILVVAHKPYWMPDDPLYLPIQVGSAAAFLPVRDDTGDNIAGKNDTFCELTALYWAWKNLPPAVEAIGLAHYRRHFVRHAPLRPKRDRLLTHKDAEALLREADILVPTPRNYRIETNWSQYAHAHHEADLAAAREVLGERYPHMTNAFDTVMRRTWGHRFNMLVMKREAFDAYCAWLFDMLFALEARLDITAYDAYNRRVFGFLAERLLDVWLEGEGRGYRETPVCFMERQNWVRKVGRFLGRKVWGKHII